MSDVTEKQLNDHKKELVKIKERSKALERLTLNPDFKLIFMEGFLKEDAARFVQLSIDMEMSQEQRQDALGTAQASGYLKKYLHYIGLMGRQAESQIDQLEQELEDLRTNTSIEE